MNKEKSALKLVDEIVLILVYAPNIFPILLWHAVLFPIKNNYFYD